MTTSQTPAPGVVTAHHGSDQSPRLTSRGQLLERFEGLLRQQLGHHAVCGHQNTTAGHIDFRSQAHDRDCTPLSKYFIYSYIFADARPRPLRRYGHTIRGLWPDAYFVTVNGRYVSCGTHPLRLLMQVSNQPDFTVNCASKL